MNLVNQGKLFNSEIFKFISVGLFITIISILLMYIFYNIFHMGYWGSSAVSYFIGSILSLLLNKNITFRNNDSFIYITPKFFINIVLCYIVAYLIAKPSIKFLLSYIKIEQVNIIEQIALLFGVCLFTFMNFIGQKYFVFRKGL